MLDSLWKSDFCVVLEGVGDFLAKKASDDDFLDMNELFRKSSPKFNLSPSPPKPYPKQEIVKYLEALILIEKKTFTLGESGDPDDLLIFLFNTNGVE
jgi:hypothetical protein